MGAYHQIGHDSENLLFEADLGQFTGAILSPVNYGKPRTLSQIQRISDDLGDDFDVILDPQLYVPQSSRGQLSAWDYFPNDVDTADTSSFVWWGGINSRLLTDAVDVHANGVASPLMLPRSELYTDDYFSFVVQIANDLISKASGRIEVWQSAVVGTRELVDSNRALEVASLISNTDARGVYLVFSTDLPPRQELQASDELEACVSLVSELAKAGLRIIVGFSSADMVLWKAAGAESCATGKFFNLRRFTRSRWLEQSDSGGGQLPYFFEEGLLAFLREADVVRLSAAGLIADRTLENPFSQAILRKFSENPGAPWLAESWRQFLYWFADCEQRISNGQSVRDLLAAAEGRWVELEDRRLLLEERRNDGAWIRPWRIAEASIR